MGFWGIEVKPGDPYPYHSDNVPGVLHVTQATLGEGSAKERSVVQCSIGHKSPIFLCALLPNKTESCSLNLEFRDDELIAFSVTGPRSIHLSGFFEAFEEEDDGDDYESDSYGEDVSASESDSLGFNTSDEYADESSDDEDHEEAGFDMCPSSPVRKSGVVIEEIEDDEKPVKEKGHSKQLKKKNNKSGSKDSTSSEKQIVVRGESGVPILESEDEDGFPISTKKVSDSDLQSPKEDAKSIDEKSVKAKTNKKTQASDVATSLKRKVENTVEEGRQEKKKNKKNKKLKEQGGNENESNDVHVEKKSEGKSLNAEMTEVPSQSQPEEKKNNKKNKKKKGKEIEENKQTNPEQSVTATTEKKKKTSETTAEKEKSNSKSSKVRNYPNGLAIEELFMGKPDGKRATPGRTAAVHYIGKLVQTGKIFDSNIGKRPFKFRLGTAQVISGWDVGVNGMRVGDKRRITIPPEMGYGSRGVPPKIPQNAWLTFDVELVDVN